MRKNERGGLTVEASIVLTFFTLFILFLFSFARVYRAQNLVSHAALQTADAVALESYLRETSFEGDVADINKLASKYTGSTTLTEDSFTSLRSADVPKIAKEKFIAAVSNSESNADTKLKMVGVKNGLSGVDFSNCTVDLNKDDVIVALEYTIEMQYPIFGGDEITVTKAAKAKTFGEILFELTTEVNVPGWGTTTGDTKVTHGTTVEITATPNYGYKFVSWDDGVTDNPRKVTVTDAKKYTAIFEKDKFGMNLTVNNDSYGSVSGAGVYDYLDTAVIKAMPTTHYYFYGWDDNGNGIADDNNGDGKPDLTNPTRSIVMDKTYNIKAIFKPKKYTISVKVNDSAYGSAVVSQSAQQGTSIQAEYDSTVTLIATPSHSVKFYFEKWSNNKTEKEISVRVTGNKEYTAYFKANTYTVTFSDVNHKTQVIRKCSINYSKAFISSSMPSNNPRKEGYIFDGWQYDNKSFSADTNVRGNITVSAKWKECKHTGGAERIGIYEPYCRDIYSNGKLKPGKSEAYREYRCNTCGKKYRKEYPSLRRHYRMHYVKKGNKFVDSSPYDDFGDYCNTKHKDSHYGYCGKYYSDSGNSHTWEGNYHVLCSYCHKEKQGKVWCVVDGKLVYKDIRRCAKHASAGTLNCPG